MTALSLPVLLAAGAVVWLVAGFVVGWLVGGAIRFGERGSEPVRSRSDRVGL